MSRASTLVLVGFLTMIVSFVGLPASWLHALLPLFGLIVIVVGFLMRADRVREEKGAMPSPPPPAADHGTPPLP